MLAEAERLQKEYREFRDSLDEGMNSFLVQKREEMDQLKKRYADLIRKDEEDRLQEQEELAEDLTKELDRSQSKTEKQMQRYIRKLEKIESAVQNAFEKNRERAAEQKARSEELAAQLKEYF